MVWRRISAPAWTLWVLPPKGRGKKKGQVPPTSSLPYQSRATELNHLFHRSALRGRLDPRAGALVALNPKFHIATCSTLSNSAYKLEAKQTHRRSNNLTRRRSPRNPGSGGEEKERCFRRYYIRGTRLHHPEKDCEGLNRARKWLHFYPKDWQNGRMYTFSQSGLAAGSDVRPAKTRVTPYLPHGT